MLQKALTVSKRVRNETAIGNSAVSIPSAAVELARQIFGSLERRRVLLLGAGKMSEISARYLVHSGASAVTVINRTLEHAQELAGKLGGTAASFDDRWQCMVEADIVISSTSCPHTILTKAEAQRIASERTTAPLVIIDIAMPRDIDPAVREVKGILLYDLDDLEKVVKHNAVEREAAAVDAQKIVGEEAQGFHRRLQAERVVPTIVALRRRLDDICRQELESFIDERGPLNKEQDQLLHAITSQITQKIAGCLARELKELPGKGDQEQMAAAVQRLFHLETPEVALAGAKSREGRV